MKIGLVHVLQGSDGPHVGFQCPSCNEPHIVPYSPINPPPPGKWFYNGNAAWPTISPSLRVMTLDGKGTACHVVVTDGTLHYQADHPNEKFRAKSVPMVYWERDDES